MIKQETSPTSYLYFGPRQEQEPEVGLVQQQEQGIGLLQKQEQGLDLLQEQEQEIDPGLGLGQELGPKQEQEQEQEPEQEPVKETIEEKKTKIKINKNLKTIKNLLFNNAKLRKDYYGNERKNPIGIKKLLDTLFLLHSIKYYDQIYRENNILIRDIIVLVKGIPKEYQRYQDIEKAFNTDERIYDNYDSKHFFDKDGNLEYPYTLYGVDQYKWIIPFFIEQKKRQKLEHDHFITQGDNRYIINSIPRKGPGTEDKRSRRKPLTNTLNYIASIPELGLSATSAVINRGIVQPGISMYNYNKNQELNDNLEKIIKDMEEKIRVGGKYKSYTYKKNKLNKKNTKRKYYKNTTKKHGKRHTKKSTFKKSTFKKSGAK
jgi:hypothetical protein